MNALDRMEKDIAEILAWARFQQTTRQDHKSHAIVNRANDVRDAITILRETIGS